MRYSVIRYFINFITLRRQRRFGIIFFADLFFFLTLYQPIGNLHIENSNINLQCYSVTLRLILPESIILLIHIFEM
jgi:hypothetical protein